jgi:2-dehydropantoate 2-reductase
MRARRYSIIGGGAIGGTIGAYLHEAGVDVRIVDERPEHVEAIREHGLTIESPEGTFTVSVPAVLANELEPPLGNTLLAVKCADTTRAVSQITSLLADDDYVVSLQNGLCETAIASQIGEARTIGAFVNFSAEYLRPGVIRYFGAGDFVVGELTGDVTRRISSLARDLRRFCEVQITTRIWDYLWSKTAYINMIGVAAIVDADQADVIDAYREVAIELATEVCEIAVLDGVNPLPFHSFEPAQYYPRELRDQAKLDHSLALLANYMRQHHKPRSGLWRDVAAGRRGEHTCLLAFVSAAGSRHGLTMPLTQELHEIIKDVTEGRTPMQWDNVARLDAARITLGYG